MRCLFPPLFPFSIYFSFDAHSGSVSNSYLYLKYGFFLLFFFLCAPVVFLFHGWYFYIIGGCHLKYLSISFQSCLYCFTEYTDRCVHSIFSCEKYSPLNICWCFGKELYIIIQNVTASKCLHLRAWEVCMDEVYLQNILGKEKGIESFVFIANSGKIKLKPLIWGRIACSILLNVKKELKCCFANILYYFFLSESSHSALCPRYVIYRVIFSFYQGTAYLANPSEIPFLISYSRVVILYNLTALDIIYFHKLQITWEKGFFFSVWGCLGFVEVVFLHSCFLQKSLKKIHQSSTKSLLLSVTLDFF